ncbi:MAG: type I restriction-modification system subunit M [Prevotella sp.]|uniref:class I SAM-dependent DNA methyltransferase n=1 Tax=Prevotella sp. TaxID=59823 RepID=UPI0025DD129D|nr:N-6 DNA methylase [Prevotella sp.]MCI7118603.1 type I restriction-modification system subunit M [Prevotella sp.]
MITGEIKNKIDQIWDTFFVAGITNPITVLEQMTYIFFMKMLDDKQLQEEENARDWDSVVENPTFPEGQLWVNPDAVSDEEKAGVPYNHLRWHVFKNLGADNMFKLVRQSVFEFIKHIGTGEESAYSRYMKSAIFLIPNARTLAKVVDGVDSLDMNNRDAMGDVYEYILGKMAASGTNGQFRTPRHIIRMIVDMMEPTPHDYICDPAMGSAGFLVEAVKYIKENNETAMFVSDEVHHMKTSMINGYDTDQTMLRIGAMNLLLHDITAPELAWRDSLSEQNEDQSCYTLIMANPPFSGSLDKGNVNKKILAYANTSKTELLFLAQFVRSLETGGRCASIVPDGVLFGTSKAHVAIRKEIVDNQQLRAVISMPSGVFKPYAGVSTAVLVFTKTNCGGTDRVWFYDMKADGFSLDDKRSPINDNDIPDVVNRFLHLDNEQSRTRKEQSFFVPVEEIRQNDYDLSINKYKEVERERVEYEPVKDILARLEQTEEKYAKGFGELKGMLEE